MNLNIYAEVYVYCIKFIKILNILLEICKYLVGVQKVSGALQYVEAYFTLIFTQNINSIFSIRIY